jgi:hypothetical protein
MKKINITIALLMSISIFANAQKKYTMRIDTAKPIHLLIKTISVMKQNVMGQEMEIKSDVSLDIDLEMFIRPKAASTMYSQTIKRVQIKSEVMGNSIEFDSDNKEDRENPIGQKIALLLDKPQKTNIKSIPSINSSTAAQDETQELLGDLDDLNKEVIYKISDTIKSNHTFINIVLLDNDTTDSDIDIFNENKNDLIKSKITYIVKSINDNYATLTFNGILNNKKTKNVQGMEAIVTMRSTVNGELLVDINTGIIKEKKTETTATGSTELMGQKIPFTLISTTTSFTK